MKDLGNYCYVALVPDKKTRKDKAVFSWNTSPIYWLDDRTSLFFGMQMWDKQIFSVHKFLEEFHIDY